MIRTKLLVIVNVLVLSLSLNYNLIYADNTGDVTKHLGKQLPLDIHLKDSKGNDVLLKDLINKPTVIDFVYFKCKGICTPIMMEVSDVIGKVKYNPGEDYNIISISIDQDETPEMAKKQKELMFSIITKDIPDSSWMFLTGDSTSIYELTDAAGFGFIRNGEGFFHKGVLIFLDDTGKIVQYLSPGYIKESENFQLLPSEFEMAIDNSSKGKVTSTIAKILQTCSNFVPKGRGFTILLLIFTSGILTLATVFIIIKKTKPVSKR